MVLLDLIYWPSFWGRLHAWNICSIINGPEVFVKQNNSICWNPDILLCIWKAMDIEPTTINDSRLFPTNWEIKSSEMTCDTGFSARWCSKIIILFLSLGWRLNFNYPYNKHDWSHNIKCSTDWCQNLRLFLISKAKSQVYFRSLLLPIHTFRCLFRPEIAESYPHQIVIQKFNIPGW